MFLYLATYGKFPGFGEVDVAMYVSDTIDNGVKSMRQNLEWRWENSPFLQKYVPEARFTDVRWEFTNLAGKKFCVRGFGASTGVRGFKEYGKRPTWLSFDDLMSDKNAESPTIVKDIENIIYKAARQALAPGKRMINWTGTPFNKKDPLYKAASNNSWTVKTYPICEQFPCSKEEFVGAWEDRFSYEFVKNEYEKLLGNNEIQAFNQELMLRIISEEDRLIQDSDIVWYDSQLVMKNKYKFNFYITTDFATSKKAKADYSVISVWAYSSNGDWLWVDGTIKKQGMNDNINDLFRYVSIYRPLNVGIEITGQQGGFIDWIQNEMISRNIFFNLASSGNSNSPGVRPTTDKFSRFKSVAEPLFKNRKIWLPKDKKNTPEMKEALDELSNASNDGFKSAHDDFLDTVSMLSVMKAFKPSIDSYSEKDKENIVHDTYDMVSYQDDLTDYDSNEYDVY